MYSVCLMVSKLFLSEYVEAGFSSDRKHEKFSVGAHILVNTQNVVISCCCFAEDGSEMYHVLLCTCRAIVLLIKSFVLPRSRWHCRRGLLKLPNESVGCRIPCNHMTALNEHMITVKPVLSGSVLNCHPLLSGQL